MARQQGDLPNIHPRKDGTFYARIELPRKRGQRKRKDVYGKTKKEVAAKCRKLLTEMEQGYDPTNPKQTVAEWLSTWLEQIIKPKSRPRTYLSYQETIEHHITPHIGYILLTKLTPDDVLALRTTLLNKTFNGKTLGRTVEYAGDILRRALAAALKMGKIPRNVATMTDRHKHISDTAKVPTIAQLRAILEAAKQSRYELLYQLAIITGVRKGELLALQWRDLDTERGTLHICATLQRYDGALHRTATKTKAGTRTIPLPHALISAFVALKAAQCVLDLSAYVFVTRIGTPIDPRNLTEDFKETIMRAGIPRDGLRFHDLRHGTATYLAALGVPPKTAMHILGHADIATTLNVYTESLPETDKEAIEKIASLF